MNIGYNGTFGKLYVVDILYDIKQLFLISQWYTFNPKKKKKEPGTIKKTGQLNMHNKTFTK